MIGDKDPEDAYDAGDPPPVRLATIGRVVDALRDGPDDEDRRHRRAVDALRLIANLEDEPGVDLIRLAELRDELEGLWMGDRWLGDLADVCRTTGWPVIEVDGWQTRARGSGGYNPGKPDHVCIHHTASPPSADGWDDVNYCTFHDDDAPLCNLYLNRAGTIWVCAAGATNTNGSGDCPHLEPDTMNSSAVGIEAGNDGIGEPWPQAQCDAYTALCSALCSAYGIAVDCCHSHAEWAPSRKTDPAGPSPWASSGTWNMDAFRGDLDQGDDDMPSAAEVAKAVWAEPCVSEVDGETYPVGTFIHSTHGLAYQGTATADWNDPRIVSEVDGREYPPYVFLKSIHGMVADIQKRVAALETRDA